MLLCTDMFGKIPSSLRFSVQKAIPCDDGVCRRVQVETLSFDDDFPRIGDVAAENDPGDFRSPRPEKSGQTENFSSMKLKANVLDVGNSTDVLDFQNAIISFHIPPGSLVLEAPGCSVPTIFSNSSYCESSLIA